MDFFESQELARKKTKWLVFFMVVAVILIVLVIQVLIGLILGFTITKNDFDTRYLFDWNTFAAVAGGVSLVVVCGSLYKIFELREGGSSIASLMGGRRIPGTTSRLVERKVMNIVEEMALASGVPVPPVYILDNEESINAFAAGYSIDDAVIGINRGTAEQLSREELQGVVAHEFSHILNGDMRMSLRMVGILHGILLISVIGGLIIRSIGSGGRSSSRSKGKDGGGVIAILAIGATLYVVGAIGLFFGRLIKSQISQQREYLADASAVQFYPLSRWYFRSFESHWWQRRRIDGPTGGSRANQPHVFCTVKPGFLAIDASAAGRSYSEN